MWQQLASGLPFSICNVMRHLHNKCLWVYCKIIGEYSNVIFSDQQRAIAKCGCSWVRTELKQLQSETTTSRSFHTEKAKTMSSVTRLKLLQTTQLRKVHFDNSRFLIPTPSQQHSKHFTGERVPSHLQTPTRRRSRSQRRNLHGENPKRQKESRNLARIRASGNWTASRSDLDASRGRGVAHLAQSPGQWRCWGPWLAPSLFRTADGGWCERTPKESNTPLLHSGDEDEVTSATKRAGLVVALGRARHYDESWAIYF
jgi:hypothetical protein